MSCTKAVKGVVSILANEGIGMQSATNSRFQSILELVVLGVVLLCVVAFLAASHSGLRVPPLFSRGEEVLQAAVIISLSVLGAATLMATLRFSLAERRRLSAAKSIVTSTEKTIERAESKLKEARHFYSLLEGESFPRPANDTPVKS